MEIEYELRVLEVDKSEMCKKLEKLGAKKIGEFNQKRYVYDLNPADENKWIRLRTNGINTTLTYKEVTKDTINGTREIEFEVEDFEKTNEFLEKIGFMNKGYQENRRVRYMLKEVEIDIDSWPMIPTYMEIEGKSENEVVEIINLLEIEQEKITALNCQDIYKEIYDINISEIKTLKF